MLPRPVRSLICAELLIPAPNFAAAETVKVALNMPMSGAFANIGGLYVKSSLFAIEAINQRGGVLNGRRFEIVAFDNKNSPQEALLVLKQIADRKIQFMVQGAGSHIAVPLAEATQRYNSRNASSRILYLNQSGDFELSNRKCNFWTFLFYANSEMLMHVLTSHVASRPQIRTVYLINQDYAFGHQIRQFALDMLTDKRPDIRVVGDDLVPLGMVKDFSPYVTKIHTAGADAVITGNWGNDLALLIKAAAGVWLNAEFFTLFGGGPGIATALGKTAIGKVKAIYRWHPNSGDIRAEQFANAYKKRFGVDYIEARDVLLPTRCQMERPAEAR